MRKIRRSNVRIIDFPGKWFPRSEDVLDTPIAESYTHIEGRDNDGAGYKTGVIVGVVGMHTFHQPLELWSHQHTY